MDTNTTLQRILVLDDDADYRKLLVKRLGKLYRDTEILEYDPVDQGMPAADYDWSAIDVLILDYDIGFISENGLDILQANVGNRQFPGTVMLTGAGSEDVAVRAFRFGVTDYLRKEWLNDEQLGAAVENAFASYSGKQQCYFTLEEAQQAVREESRKVMDDFKSRFAKIRELEKQRLHAEWHKLEGELKKSRQLLAEIDRQWKKSEGEKQELLTELKSLKDSQSKSGSQIPVKEQLDNTQNIIAQIKQEYHQVKARIDRAEWKQDMVSVNQEQLTEDIAGFIKELAEQEKQSSGTHQQLESKLQQSREQSQKKKSEMAAADRRLLSDIASQVDRHKDS